MCSSTHLRYPSSRVCGGTRGPTICDHAPAPRKHQSISPGPDLNLILGPCPGPNPGQASKALPWTGPVLSPARLGIQSGVFKLDLTWVSGHQGAITILQRVEHAAEHTAHSLVPPVHANSAGKFHMVLGQLAKLLQCRPAVLRGRRVLLESVGVRLLPQLKFIITDLRGTDQIRSEYKTYTTTLRVIRRLGEGREDPKRVRITR